jgi:predicted metal-binding membrane protein
MTMRARILVGVAVLAVALAGWLALLAQMRGMTGPDAGLAWLVAFWVTMTAAMMLPSAAPAVLLVSTVRGRLDTLAFVTAYLVAWSGAGIVAYGGYETLGAVTSWHVAGPWGAGAALVVAGLYQLTPLKDACLRRCRSPLSFVARGRRGRVRAATMGLGHAAFCIGCCAGLMLALFALGAMSLFWMGAAASAILAEKTFPAGEWLARVTGLALLVLGAWML